MRVVKFGSANVVGGASRHGRESRQRRVRRAGREDVREQTTWVGNPHRGGIHRVGTLGTLARTLGLASGVADERADPRHGRRRGARRGLRRGRPRSRRVDLGGVEGVRAEDGGGLGEEDGGLGGGHGVRVGTGRAFERAMGFDASREEHRGVERCARLALGGGEAREGVDRDADHLGRGRVGGVRHEGVEGIRREGVAARAERGGDGGRAPGEVQRRGGVVGGWAPEGARANEEGMRGGDGRGRRGRGDGRAAAADIVVVVPEETPRVVGRHANGRHARRGVVVGGGRARPNRCSSRRMSRRAAVARRGSARATLFPQDLPHRSSDNRTLFPGAGTVLPHTLSRVPRRLYGRYDAPRARVHDGGVSRGRGPRPPRG